MCKQHNYNVTFFTVLSQVNWLLVMEPHVDMNEPNSIEQVMTLVKTEVESIPHKNFKSSVCNIWKCAKLCVNADDGHFEQLLKHRKVWRMSCQKDNVYIVWWSHKPRLLLYDLQK